MEKSTIHDFIRQLNSLPVVHDWTLSSPPPQPSSLLPQASQVSSSASIHIQVKELKSKHTHSLCVETHQTALDLKQALYKLTKIPIEEQRLIINGKALKDAQAIVQQVPNLKTSTLYLSRIQPNEHTDGQSTSEMKVHPSKKTTPSYFTPLLFVESFRKEYEALMKKAHHKNDARV
jgi:hypothetical protein